MENKKKCIKPVEPVVEPEPAIKPVRLKNRFLKHCSYMFLNLNM